MRAWEGCVYLYIYIFIYLYTYVFMCICLRRHESAQRNPTHRAYNTRTAANEKRTLDPQRGRVALDVEVVHFMYIHRYMYDRYI